MTANEMRLLFKDLYDGASDIEMGFDDSEVSRFLTIGQNLELESRYFANRNQFAEGYEKGSKRDNEFTELKKHVYIYNDTKHNRSVIVEQSGSVVYANLWEAGYFPHTHIIELPDDFMYHSMDAVDIFYNGNKRYNIRVKSVNEDNVAEIYDNVFVKPDKRTVYRMSFNRRNHGRELIDNRTSRRCMILTDENTILRRYYLSYIRQPNDIVVDILEPSNQRHCELNESFHLSIVRRAVQSALGSIGSEKYQVSLNEKALNE